MATKHQLDPKAAVLAHGYLLEMALARFVEAERPTSRDGTRWAVAAKEVGWTDPKGDRQFADFVLRDDSPGPPMTNYWGTRIVVECKNPADSQLIFLAPKGTERERDLMVYRTRSWLPGEAAGGWVRATLAPPSYRAAYCVVDPKESSNEGLTRLEKTCGNLLRSIEAIAMEEIRSFGPAEVVGNQHMGTGEMCHAALVLTNHDLRVCLVDASQIDPATGRCDHEHLEVIDVDLVRFEKTMDSTPTLVSPASRTSLGEIQRVNQRTVLIARAATLGDLLSQWSFWRPRDL